MVENFEWFFAALLVIIGAVGMGAACFLLIDLVFYRGETIKSWFSTKRMPKRICRLNRIH
ncbi:hypothetical protein ACODYM_29105 [Burkholderia gladioli]|uniref:hypothetical protein n=1 Tax=Burkholderia gladioli TaxID=28095 RepID=UPI003B513A49